MSLFVKYVRDESLGYGSYEGQSEEIIRQLLTDLGATEIEFISEADYLAISQGE